MKLHEQPNLFRELIAQISHSAKIDTALIEKDYFITLILQDLASRLPYLVFKGGTSLSKCYKSIDRFSEDIDLTLEESAQTQGQKKHVKQAIISACNALALTLTNPDDIKSRRDYNCYKITYPITAYNPAINPFLLVETTYITKPFPCETRPVTSIVYDYLSTHNYTDLISHYNLSPFPIRVQTLDRTLIDKIFALCDYYILNQTARNSRHIYDICKLLPQVELTDQLKQLALAVRTERQKNPRCYSAQNNVILPDLLTAIIRTNFYKKDYETVTSAMLYRPLSYGEALRALEIIIESNIFGE